MGESSEMSSVSSSEVSTAVTITAVADDGVVCISLVNSVHVLGGVLRVVRLGFLVGLEQPDAVRTVELRVVLGGEAGLKHVDFLLVERMTIADL
ncbi:hypothetical protein MTO96_010439 [Rhipicephalus appendiculatus]